MNAVGHEMILASAGSGKTYALTNRIIRLLALGAAPERIVALTFTRKAAGEFFDVILRKLAEAAADPARATSLAREIDCPRLGCGDFLALLRAMVDAMPRLSFGTFDAFFARIVRTFPLELGLAGDFELLQEHAALVHRRRVLHRMFARAAGREGPDPQQRVFIEAFKQATYGIEQKSVESLLAAYLDAHQEVYLDVPDGDLWGNAARIWPYGCPWPLDTDGEALTRAALALRARVDAWAGLGDKQRARLHAFVDAVMEWTPNVPLSSAIKTPLENALGAWDALRAGAGTLNIAAKKTEFAGDDAAALVAVVRAIFGVELRRRIEITRGLHAVLAHYEGVYHQLVRRAGQLNFADVERLLAPDAGAPALAFGASTGEDDREGRRLAIDWRLDARFDHWLLDEFQDTSHGQWSVLHNLIDEVVQDTSGERTFFYVGDAKQAIYAWRAGDARLMREIADHYNRAPGSHIVETPLHESWRSAPPLLAMVNRVFSGHDALARNFPGDVATRWRREWVDHTPARPQLAGHAAWIHADDKAARFKATLDLLLALRPTERGLTSAVLVQKNDTATELANHLRQEGGLPAIAEADLHVCTDNPLTVAVLALFKAAAHPGDSLAWQHVHMTPLRAVLEAGGLATPDGLSRHVLAQVFRDGFEHAVTAWVEALEPHLAADDTFSRMRGRQMAEAARLFDETGGREVAEFVAFMQRHKIREPESSGVVRVMTIHKSKGLGFDVVILPDLEGRSIDGRRDGLAVQRAADRSPEWVLDLPGKVFHEHDARLAAHVEAARADACYDKLALLYVAMTRAKQGLYVVTEPSGDSTSRNFPRLLTDTLGDESQSIMIGSRTFTGPFSAGDPAWFASIVARPPPPPEPGMPALDPSIAPPAPRRTAVAPSHHTEGSLPAATLFATSQEDDAAAFGSAVHSLLASVHSWNDTPAGGDSWTAAKRAAGHGDAAIAEALACLRAPHLRDVFTISGSTTEVWRERTFEIILDGAWVTGVFDRVHVERDATGAVARVTVHDFKTDRIDASGADPAPELATRYRRQMHLYRRAAAVLTGVPAERIRCLLVPTSGRLPAVEV